MDSPDGTRKQANANKQNDKKSLGVSKGQKKVEGDDQKGKALDQDNVDGLAKE